MQDQALPSRRPNKRAEARAERNLRPNLETVVRDNLRPMVAGLGGFYILWAAISAVVHPKTVAVPMVTIGTTTAALLLGLACVLRRHPIPLRWAHPVTGAISGLVLLNCLTALYLIREPQQTTNFMLLVIGVGCLMLSTRWLLLVLVTTLASWSLFVLVGARSSGWPYFAIALVSATGLSILIHLVRVRSLSRLESLRLQDEMRKTELEAALASAGRELAERRRTEELLRASEERHRNFIENAKDVIYTTDLEGNFLSVNKAAEEIIGYTRDEARRMRIAEIVAPDHLDRARQIIAPNALNEVTVPYELEIITKDRRKVTLEVSTRTPAENGKPIRVEGIARDVTERKRLEEQLRLSQKMEAVGQLAGGVAHDFNNLLTAIKGYAELALDRLPKDNPVRKDIDEISRAGDRAAALTRQLLAFSRRQVLQQKALNLNSVVAGVEKMLRCLMGEGIELSTVLDSALGKVKADPGQMEQVLMNLCINARDAMEGGGVLIIETANVMLGSDYTQEHAEVRPGSYIMLAVMDTGCGMDDPTMQHMFEPFFTTKEVGKGTGLGLATVHGIVKQHEGHIWVYSEPGNGTTFKIHLPQVDAKEEKSPATEIVEPVPLGTETILLVEDEVAVRLMAERILREKGYTVLVAPDPETAEVLFAHNPGITLLLTDIVMPGRNGRDLYERLAAIQPSLKVLYISGYTDHTILRKGLLNPGTPFLQKPFAPSTLAQKIREVLDTQETTPATDSHAPSVPVPVPVPDQSTSRQRVCSDSPSLVKHPALQSPCNG